MGERAYIDPREAEKLRSSVHTPEEKKERHERAKGLIRKLKPMEPQIKELQERQLEPEKFLTKEEKEERDRESI